MDYGTMTLKLPIVAPSLNKWYSGGHWRKRHALAEEWHAVVKRAAREQGFTEIGVYPLVLSVQSNYKQRGMMDTSNTFPALKLAEDGLVRAGLIQGDDLRYVVGSEILTPTFGGKVDETVLTIRVAGVCCPTCGRR